MVLSLPALFAYLNQLYIYIEVPMLLFTSYRVI